MIRRAMEKADRKLYVQILAQMLIADGVLADEERAHLEGVMDRLGMAPDERREALRDVSIDSPVEDRVAALGAAARAQIVAEIESAMAIDGEVTRSEQAFLERVRALVG